MAEIPKIVSQRMGAMNKPAAHPDPDLITAFVERSLGKRERIQVLEHLSRCAGCREMVSLSNVPTETAGAVSSVPQSPGWLSWPVLRWGAAVACVVVVGAAVTLRHPSENAPTSPEVAQSSLESKTQVQTPIGEFAKQPASANAFEREPKATAVTKHAEPRPTAPSSPATASASAPAMSGRMFGTSANRQARTLNPVQMADAASSPMAEVVPGRAKAPLAEAQDAKSGSVLGGDASLKKETVEASGAAASVATDALTSPNLSPRWTLSSDGTLQRSLDSGRTWQTIPVAGKAIFRALAANGLDIWVGGAAGALFHSSNAGQQWTQVRPIASGEALTDDIIGVEFTDLLHGKLTTSGAETWTTADAGQTWQMQ